MSQATSITRESRPIERTLIRAMASLLLVITLTFLLLGCGGPRRVLGPPSISVQEIENVGGRYMARVRFDSPASMAVTLQHFDWRLILDQTDAGKGRQILGQTLPPVAGDTLSIDLGSVDSLPALATLDTNSSMSYVLEGELKCSEPNARFQLRYEGRLRATPGKPGSFR